MHTEIIYNYQDFFSDISSLAARIKRSDFKPDVIVGIARGGLVPATYLSQALKIPLISASWSLRDGMVSKNIPYLEIEKYGYNVLLVDDLIDSGETFIEILNDFSTVRAPFNVQSAVMWQNTDCAVQAEFYERTIGRETNNAWVIFPWEMINV